MDQATKDRFASGFRGTKKDDKKPEDKAADVAIVIAPEGDAGSINAEGTTDAGTQGAGAAETGPGTGSVGDEGMPEMTHSEKTWQGRLKKREDELKAMEAAAKAASNPTADGAHAVTASPEQHAMDPNEPSETPAEEMGESPAEEVAEQPGDDGMDMMAATEGEELPGSTSDVMANAPEDIKAIATRWGSDFGPEFMDDLAKFVGYIAESSAGKIATDALGPLQQQASDVQSTLDSIIDSFQGMHQGDIEDQEPEFEKLVNSAEFEQWVTEQEPEAQQRIVKVLQGGSAGRIVRVLKQYKDFVAANNEPAPGMVDTSALDAAAGVRSSGVSVPDVGGASGGASPDEAFKRGFYRSKTA